MADLGSAVGIKNGVPCANSRRDMKAVMDLLEQIPVSRGGVRGDPHWSRPPVTSLRRGHCPLTLWTAIRHFQDRNRSALGNAPDGHVDPGGPTIRLMNALATAGGGVQTLGEVVITGGLRDIELEIHDARIPGSGRFGRRRVVRYVDARTPYSAVLALIDIEVRLGRQITRLDILAHGFHIGGDDDRHPLFGIMVGREGIHPGFTAFRDLKYDDGTVVFGPGRHADNISLWARFKGRIDEIRLYACGAANPLHRTGTGIADMDMSGSDMCGRLAVLSGAYVMAAQRMQGFTYQWDVGDWPWRSRTLDPGRNALPADPALHRPARANTSVAPTDFGKWEGPVYVFSPISGHVVATSTDGNDPVYRRGA